MPPPTREELWKSGQDETVEVNQRALIDTRYSGEHTIFRELLQNADDAGAQHVQIKFYSHAGTEASDAGPSRLPDVKKDPMVKYVVTNDGIPFRPQDWQRLKKIAEGNPDEEKIGAFGVGFYSLWSVCDEPFVESGEKWMGFYWKDGKDQLMARSGDLPPSASSSTAETSSTGHPWTSFTMNLREPTILEGPLDLARFFITSLTFMRTIKKIDMMVDDVKVLQVFKSVKGKERVWKKSMKETSPNGMMKVAGVDAEGMVIMAKVMKWLSATGFVPPPLPAPLPTVAKSAKAFTSFLSNSFFKMSSPSPAPVEPPPPPPPPEDPFEITTLHREIQVYQADIKVTVSPTFGRELERATKKPPPSRMPASLVFARSDDAEAIIDGKDGDQTAAKDVGGVFSGLCPPLDGEKSAKIFIGQATSQTTGIGGHVSARFIPTVERESIDLVDQHVSHWNRELLWIGGYLSRLIYELELQSLHAEWSKTSVADSAVRSRLLAKGLHALRFFTFKPTTPSSVVGQEMESAFYQCVNDNKTFPLISNVGILPVSQVRMPSAELQKFLPDLPVLTQSTIDEAPRQIARLRERNLLRDVTIEDVVKGLGSRPLSETEMIAALAWWQTIAGMEGYNNAVRSRLLDAAVLVMDDGKVVPLSIIQTVVKPQSSSIPPGMPLPTHTLPYSITKDLRGPTIQQIFGWVELTLTQYISFLVSPPMSNTPTADADTDLRVSPVFAELVLGLLGRAWQSISAAQQSGIALELKDVPCIPTKAGFKKPGEAYFEKNLLFDDLPTIALPNTKRITGGMEKMLLAIGVRRTVDLQLVFSRLVGGGSWTCLDLTKYLVSVKDTLSSDEMARLRQTAAFPLEQDAMSDGTKRPVVRQKPHQLYEPTDAMRGLGLPVLDWGEGNKWRSNSDEAKMMFTLGLRKYPPIDVLLGIAAGRAPMNDKALQYLLANLTTHYVNFDPSAFAGVSFIPAVKPDGSEFLAKPGEVFTNWACAILGFAVAQASVSGPDIAAKLRIATDPPMERLVAAVLGNPTQDIAKAKKIFEYMATRIGHAPSAAVERLHNAAFVPVKTEDVVRLHRPSEVYFGDGQDAIYRAAFTFVDFGERANVFLRHCGVRSEPSVKDIARLLMREPKRMLEQAGSPDKYLEQLRLLAANWSSFDVSIRQSMKVAPFLLASQRVPVKRPKKLLGLGGGVGDDEYEREWILCRASEVAVNDDITLLQYFGRYVLAAPEEQLLETFYEQLGAKALSGLVRTEYITNGHTLRPSDDAKRLRQHVLERLTIFLAEARRRSSDYSVDTLSKEGNFEVVEVGDLRAKYTLKQGKQEYSHLEKLYATASKGRGKAIILTISNGVPPDEFDIASALCAILLKNPKADDALLLFSILTTPLMALKKRGFNVDRILNQHREEKLRLQAEAVRDREKALAEAKERSASGVAPPTVSYPNDDGASIRSEQTAVSNGTPDGSVSGKTKGLLDKLKRRGSKSSTAPPLGALAGGLADKMGSLGLNGATGAGGGVGGVRGPAGGSVQSTKRPTDLNNIRATVQKAIDASRPEMGTQISDSRQAVKDVSESQNDYCDTSASADIILALQGGAAGLNLWVPRGTTDLGEFLQDRMEVCERFAAEVLIPIGRVFRVRPLAPSSLPRSPPLQEIRADQQLSPEVLNVFWDLEGPLIAFNRGGTIFCNARYFAAWHDQSVRSGQIKDAFISWYFTIAHELAHNLESAHNAAHEFYFSSIAEEYLLRFAPLVR